MDKLKEKLEEIRQAKDQFSNKLEWPEDVTQCKIVCYLEYLLKTIEEKDQQIEKALELILRYGGIDGDHHKMRVMDQVVRILADDYKKWVRNACDGEDGPDTYGWDEGIAP